MILVCAATRTEADACRRGIADAGAGADELEVLETGVGPAQAGAALARRLEAARTAEAGGVPALVVSSGFAGALGAGIALLAWVTASEIHRGEGGRAVRVALPEGLLRVAPGAAPVAVVSAERVVLEGGRALPGLPIPAVVDMESAALAEVSAAAGVPFTVLRVVTDTPEEPLPAIARSIAAALAARGAARAAGGLRVAADAARSPADALRLVRHGLLWRERLRAGWRERALRGLLPGG